MKAILEFNLPEEREEFEASSKGLSSKVKIDSIYDEVFRPYLKYGKEISNKELTEDEYHIIYTIWEEVRDHFQE
jgi:hypothetical protein